MFQQGIAYKGHGMAILTDYLSRVLMSRLHVTEVSLAEFASGFRMPENLVSAPKLLLVLSGQIVYQLEDRQYLLDSGAMFFRGSWTRASWCVPATVGENAMLAYCEFHVDVQEPGPLEPLLLDFPRQQVERDAVQRMVSLRGDQGTASELVREAEAKAMLARFIVCANITPTDKTGTGDVPARSDAIVLEALNWLQQHYTDPAAVSNVPLGGLTASHFRTRFRRRVGMSPRDYVTMLRMRSARYRIHQTNAPIKQIAFDLGYNDPLYFSRLYHRFWSWWPSQDRASSAPSTPTDDDISTPSPS